MPNDDLSILRLASDDEDRPMSGYTGNGKTGELVRWVVAMGASALIAYFSGQISTERRMSTVEEKQNTADVLRQFQFDEIQRTLARLEAELRDVKQSVSGKAR